MNCEKCGKPSKGRFCSERCKINFRSQAYRHRKGVIPRGTPMPFNCEKCRAPGIRTHGRTLYCDACALIVKREQEKLYRLRVRPVANIDRNMKPATVRYLLKAGCLSTLTVTQLKLAGFAYVHDAMSMYPDHVYPGRGPIGWEAEMVAA